jgi:hypothetical protein
MELVLERIPINHLYNLHMSVVQEVLSRVRTDVKNIETINEEK